MKKLLMLLVACICLTTLSAQQLHGSKTQIEKIQAQSKKFSAAYMAADYDAMMDCYTTDGKIFPNGALIIEGHDAIRKRWVLPAGDRVTKHVASPDEIRITGDYAYDYGYYEGETTKADGSIQQWKGKYVIVWKQDRGEWKMYLDIWNRVN